jgi:hypothetical protein
MTDTVGDSAAPAIKPYEGGLRTAADQAFEISAIPAGKSVKPIKAANLSDALQGQSQQPDPTSCKQKIWFSFFFDGTGNNMDADLPKLKHSNVARLYRAHDGIDPNPNRTAKSGSDKPPEGIYKLYLPGVGTYFKEIGDPGGTTLGGAMGRYGEDRLDWAKKQFYKAMKKHFERAQNPQNDIVEINISAFGFSRGAALARAFIKRFIEQECNKTGETLRLQQGNYKVYARFLGIFDTVASVGPPMSMNNTSTIGGLLSDLQWMISSRKDDTPIKPETLAFAASGAPGADPSPGVHNGHDAWGGELAIPFDVEEVRHFVSAHELRNSFPLDSVSQLQGRKIVKSPNFYEIVYPGVHSDVGGSYRPHEGGKQDSSKQKIGLIAGNDMYEAALTKGLPFKPRSKWSDDNFEDFEVDDETRERYNYYLGKAASAGSLGDLFNSHMTLYYQWRFYSINKKKQGDKTEQGNIEESDKEFKKEADDDDKEIKDLQKKSDNDKFKLENATRRMYNGSGSAEEVDDLKRKSDASEDALLSAKARKDSLPKAGVVEPALEIYDQCLYDDAIAIQKMYRKQSNGGPVVDQNKRANLRPHYKAMMDAFEAEFNDNKGLQDETLIKFFEIHIHDSLAGFAKDATLPSDPRAIYLGGDEKYKYAMLEQTDSDNSMRVV